MIHIDTEKLDVRQAQHRDYLRQLEGIIPKQTPNIVLVFVDDMGHGDLSVYGSQAIRTPNLDKMAHEGLRMQDFYAASPVCSPSRYSLLTGRYPPRGFMHFVFFPTVEDTPMSPLYKKWNSTFLPHGLLGLLPDEVTLAEVLQKVGYRTGLFGKWHLGDQSPHLPNEKGFDHFFGSYYSNDMEPYAYYRNHEIALEAPVDQTQLTRNITTEIKDFIRQAVSKDQPFFAYYPSPFPHTPVHASEAFSGRSDGGPYGDCVEEIDWSVGEINRLLEELGVQENTLFIFTSDNGPWHEGSPGFHRGRKYQTWDGGQIVPFIAKWPGTIPAGRVTDEMAMNIDLMPTIMNLVGIPQPSDRVIDGVNILDLMTGKVNQTPHDMLHFVKGDRSMGARHGHFKYESGQHSDNAAYHHMMVEPMMFNLKTDQNESYNLIPRHPKLTAKFEEAIEAINHAFATNPRGYKTEK